MATVLFAQEFGANLGHVGRLTAVAKALPASVRKVFALPDPQIALGTIRAALGEDAEILPAPRFQGPIELEGGLTPEYTLGDVFYNLGYSDPGALRRATARWQNLVQNVRPDLLVTDFAPTARLATWGRVPFVHVGCGYVTPPAGMTLRPIVENLTPVTGASLRSEERLIAAAQQVSRDIGGPPVSYFSDLFQGERIFVATDPTLDPYAAIRSGPTVSFFSVADLAVGPAFDQRTGPDIFCYIWATHPSVNTILTALNGIAHPSQVHVRGVDPQVVARNCAPQVAVRTGSADFRSMLPQSQLFLHYGGASACYWGLLAGVMQLIVPFDLEKQANTRRLVGTGGTIGLNLAETVDIEALRRLIERQLANKAMQAAALATAVHHQKTRRGNPLPEIAAACLSLLPSRA